MEWMIYGANGYTGELIAREAKRQGKSPILAGRSAAKIVALASKLTFTSKAFRLERPSEIVEALRGVRLVLNCAGPFSKTADPLMRACIAAKAHYLDITGEIDVLEGAHRFDSEAKAAGVVLCPGAGFDVVPTDCIALMLKKALPQATELALGFEVSGRQVSAGTAKTLVEG
ncbi:MAG: saccharopine dehydrogenase family protein, partial [Methylocella sp.]